MHKKIRNVLNVTKKDIFLEIVVIVVAKIWETEDLVAKSPTGP